MIEVTLAYRREGSTMLSAGRVSVKQDDAPAHDEVSFEHLEYKRMMRELSYALRKLPDGVETKVIIQRTDRPGINPYVLDPASVSLLRTDPVAGLAAMSVESPSPMQVLENIKKAAAPPTPLPTLRVGNETLADAFGENVAFKVRAHELECPGCGFWGVYTTPRLLNDPDRAGQVFKTAFVCHKRCNQRFIVSCHKEWGFVGVEDLLKTPLAAFYLPRGWNNRRPWVSRADLQQKYDDYKKEKDAS